MYLAPAAGAGSTEGWGEGGAARGLLLRALRADLLRAEAEGQIR